MRAVEPLFEVPGVLVVRSALSTLSLIEPRPQMPDPTPHRGLVAALIERIEAADRKR